MRINQFLSRNSHLSRRAADTAITEGRVLINGRAAELGDQVGETDEVTVDGALVAVSPLRYVLLNKPVGYVCSRSGQGGSHTIYDLLPPDMQDLKSIGRLDKDSSGLLVLTNDGQLAQELSHPSFEKTKLYQVELDHPASSKDIQALTRGVELEDGQSRLGLSGQGRRWTVALSEGRNRQIRRSFAAVGYTVKTLHRTEFGKLKLDVQPGRWRDLRREELS